MPKYKTNDKVYYHGKPMYIRWLATNDPSWTSTDPFYVIGSSKKDVNVEGVFESELEPDVIDQIKKIMK